jgi:hypothetical protein
VIWLALAGALDDMWHQIFGHNRIGLSGNGASSGTGARATGVAGVLQKWFDVPGGAFYWMG